MTRAQTGRPAPGRAGQGRAGRADPAGPRCPTSTAGCATGEPDHLRRGGTGYRVRGALGAETAGAVVAGGERAAGVCWWSARAAGGGRPSVGVARHRSGGGACRSLAARPAGAALPGRVGSGCCWLVGARAARLRVDVRTGVQVGSASSTRPGEGLQVLLCTGSRPASPRFAVAPGWVLTAAEFQRRLPGAGRELDAWWCTTRSATGRGRIASSWPPPGWTARCHPDPVARAAVPHGDLADPMPGCSAPGWPRAVHRAVLGR